MPSIQSRELFDGSMANHCVALNRDMIERFIEEQEQQLCTAVGVVNGSSTTSFLSSELKRQSPNSSISFVALHAQETMKRPLDEADLDNEQPTAKKAALNGNHSSATAKISST
jgi:hypothetical protein